MNNPQIIAINLSVKKDHPRSRVTKALIDGNGMVGDSHSGKTHRQICILGQESLDRFEQRTGHQIPPGTFGENLTISGIDLCQVAVLDRLAIGEVMLEITQVGKKCYGEVCKIFCQVGECAMSKEGVFARVIAGGAIEVGMAVKYILRPLKILIITCSDRASSGHYQDQSGPAAEKLIQQFFSDKRWHLDIHKLLIPDDALQLRTALQRAIQEKFAMIFTLGGTGVGPRDITPEIVMEVCDKVIPGIMTNIRMKFGADNPLALLSRSVAGIAKTTQVYTLPGSVQAVTEYLTEIFKTVEHLIYMLYSIDLHQK